MGGRLPPVPVYTGKGTLYARHKKRLNNAKSERSLAIRQPWFRPYAGAKHSAEDKGLMTSLYLLPKPAAFGLSQCFGWFQSLPILHRIPKTE